LKLIISRMNKHTRGKKRTLDKIKFHCLRSFQMTILDEEEKYFQITIAHDTEEELNDLIETLLFEMNGIADDNECFIEADFTNKNTGQFWS